MNDGASHVVCANLDHFGVLRESRGHERSRGTEVGELEVRTNSLEPIKEETEVRTSEFERETAKVEMSEL